MQPLSLSVLWDPFFSILILQKNTGNSKQTSLYAFRIWAKVMKNEPEWSSDSLSTKLKNCLFLQFFFCPFFVVLYKSAWHTDAALRFDSSFILTSTKTSRNRRKAKSIKAGKRVVGHKQKCFRWHSVCGSWWLCEYSLICWPECWLFPRLLGTLGGLALAFGVCVCVCVYTHVRVLTWP